MNMARDVASESPPDLLRWNNDWQATAKSGRAISASTDPASVERTTGKLQSYTIVPSTDTASVECKAFPRVKVVAVRSLIPPARGRWGGNAKVDARFLLTVYFASVFLCLQAAIAQASEPSYMAADGARSDLVTVDFVQPVQDQPEQSDDLDEPAPEEPELDLDPLAELEQLLQEPVIAPALGQEVTSVSRQESTVLKSAAAVFVITNDMIRRSGATSIPEVLRMAPGVNVARIDSNKWAVSIRGFNNRFVNKLLVQIDGRVIYTQLFGGVYWDVPDVVLQDVERIEVIRGPGATVWGSNAVNGIINIITKNSIDTQGTMVSVIGGTEDNAITSVRYGGCSSDGTLHYRVYGKWFERGTQYMPSGAAQLPPPPGGVPFARPNDDWRAGRGGFRIDWQATGCDDVMLQGEMFAVSSGRSDFRPQAAPPFAWQNLDDEQSTGGHVLMRWQHETGENANWTLQFFWDRFDRESTNFNNVNAINVNHPVNIKVLDTWTDTYDLEFQQQFPLGERHKLIYGLGYRQVDSFFGGTNGDGGFAIGSDPANRTLHRYAAFVQDEIALVHDRLFFTAGCKFEHNTFAGFQYQPTGRLLWSPTERQALWGAVSRAVRIPSVGEDAFLITGFTANPGVFVQTIGNKNLVAEDLMAYELGYRAQPTGEFWFDVALFYNVYNNLVGARAAAPIPGPPLIVPVNRVNALSAETYGFELTANWKVTETWRLQGNYSFLRILAHTDPGINPGAATSIEGQTPRNQIYLQSSWDIGCNWEFDLIGRYVDQLTNFPSAAPSRVPSYISLDARLGWRPNDCWELAVVGQNLLDSHHLEFGGNQFLSAPLIELQRSVYGSITYEW